MSNLFDNNQTDDLFAGIQKDENIDLSQFIPTKKDESDASIKPVEFNNESKIIPESNY